MKPKQLKNGILHLAITGKLVKQNPNDEPTSVLLEKIRAEKQKLIKEGKIKKDKNESVIFRGEDDLFYEKIGKEVKCINDEIPFEIPDSWQWIRLGNVSTYSLPKKKAKISNIDKDVWELELEDIQKGGKLLERKTVGERNSKGDKTYFKKGDILYSKLRPYLLKILIADNDGICTSEIIPFSFYGNIYNKYVLFYLKSAIVNNKINQLTYGTKMPRVGTETMINILIPLPPLEEQKRIAEKLDEIMPLIDIYDENYTELEKLDKEFPSKMKKSILQEAIQGKLVKQNPNDEPASVLLEKIRAEKQKLIKEGKIKKDKNESVIFCKDGAHYEKIGNEERCIEEDIPFEIPSSWQWVRLGSICKSITAGGDKPLNYSKNKTSELSIPIYSNGEKNNGLFGYTNIARITEPSITVSARGTIGFSVIRNEPYTPIVRLIIIIPFKFILLEYLQKVFSLLLKKYDGVGTSIQQLTVPMITPKLIPLPPLEEQKRIVEKIEEIFKELEPLEEK